MQKFLVLGLLMAISLQSCAVLKATSKVAAPASKVADDASAVARGASKVADGAADVSKANPSKVAAVVPVGMMKFSPDELRSLANGQIDSLPAPKQQLYQSTYEETAKAIKERGEMAMDVAQEIAFNELQEYCEKNQITMEESDQKTVSNSIGKAAMNADSKKSSN
jgi:hypothetical protein